MIDNGGFSVDEWVYAWIMNPPRKPGRPLEVGDCWQSDDDTELHYVDMDRVERYLLISS